MIGAVLFYGWGRPGRRGEYPRETPHEVLRRRLANGEITPQQYEERKACSPRHAHPLDLRLTRDALTVRGHERGAAPISLGIKDEVYEFAGGSTRAFRLGNGEQ